VTVNAELALAASRVRELSEQIPEVHRPPVAERWAALMDELEACRSDGGRLLVILHFREDFEAELCAKLSHAALQPSSQDRSTASPSPGQCDPARARPTGDGPPCPIGPRPGGTGNTPPRPPDQLPRNRKDHE
jgi:hypothetical protein